MIQVIEPFGQVGLGKVILGLPAGNGGAHLVEQTGVGLEFGRDGLMQGETPVVTALIGADQLLGEVGEVRTVLLHDVSQHMLDQGEIVAGSEHQQVQDMVLKIKNGVLGREDKKQIAFGGRKELQPVYRDGAMPVGIC